MRDQREDSGLRFHALIKRTDRIDRMLLRSRKKNTSALRKVRSMLRRSSDRLSFPLFSLRVLYRVPPLAVSPQGKTRICYIVYQLENKASALVYKDGKYVGKKKLAPDRRRYAVYTGSDLQDILFDFRRRFPHS